MPKCGGGKEKQRVQSTDILGEGNAKRDDYSLLKFEIDE
jgi:hypothetical protein